MAVVVAPVDVLVVDAVAERHSWYRDLLQGFGGRVVAVAPGADAIRLYGEGGFAAALLHLDGAEDDRHAVFSAIAALGEASSGPPVVVVSEAIPEFSANARSSASLIDYVPASSAKQVLVARISCLLELQRLRHELARRDARLAEFEREVSRLVQKAAEERRNSDAIRAQVGEQIHRGKNLLAIVQSIALRTIIDGRDIPEARATLMGRLQALARAYHLVTKSDEKGVEISDVVDAELADVRHRVVANGPRVRLTSSAVQTFALALHELSTNAMKHGALAAPEGAITLGWTLFEREADRYLDVAWRERGGPAARAPPRHGFGLALVSSFSGTRGSSPNVVFDDDGFHCLLRLSRDVLVDAPDAPFSRQGGAES